MSPPARMAALLGGIVVIAAAGVGLDVYLRRPAIETPLVPAPEPAPGLDMPPKEAQEHQALFDASKIEFVHFVRPFSLVRDSAAYVAPSSDAPQFYPLRSGTPLMSVSKSRDGIWIISLMQDGQAAYLPAADLGPYAAPAQPSPLPTPGLSGAATVVDTATLDVDGQRVSLFGITGLGGSYADKLGKLIAAQGGQVDCTAKGQQYVCRLPNGNDIARVMLFNGTAIPNGDAPADYRRQDDAAKAAPRGRWQ